MATNNGEFPNYFKNEQEMLEYIYKNNIIPNMTNNQFETSIQPQLNNNGINDFNRQFLTGQEDAPTEIQQGMIDAGYPSTVEPTESASTVRPYDAPFQFFNPYGGYDLPSATYRLGESIREGDTLGTVGGGLKVASSLARNFLGGYSQSNRNQQLMEEYRTNQRKALTQQNTPVIMEEGGEMIQQPQNEEEQILLEVATALEQGQDPQAIVEALVGMGVDEETAMGMVDFVLQQTQQPTEELPEMEDGGQYFDRLVGKKIKSYSFNKNTNSYDVEYE